MREPREPPQPIEVPGPQRPPAATTASDLVTKEARVLWIADLMTKRRWPAQYDSGAYRAELAAVWGISENTVRGYSAEAHRLVALDPDLREQLKAATAARLNDIAESALSNVSLQTGLPDYASAIKALDMSARYAGIELETKVTLGGAVKLESIDEILKRLPPEDTDDNGGKPSGD